MSSVKWRPPKLPMQKMPLEEEAHIKSLLTFGMPKPKQSDGNMRQQAIGVRHHNANSGFSHNSLGFRFRRYGK